MRTTQLILIEGISGSGKSTMAHYLSRQLTQHGIQHTWWYEEDKWHPLYPFRDQASMQQVLDTLATDNYGLIIDAVLKLWQQFADSVQSSEDVVIMDSCLFGYLTGVLFPFNIPLTEIQAYLTHVEQIISSLSPCLIYLYQNDLANAIRKKCQRRGVDEESITLQATESAYGKNRNLQEFDGMLHYWTDYRHFTDTAFSNIGFANLSIENSAGDWLHYQQQVLDFLDLLPLPELTLSLEVLDRFTGTYSFTEDDTKHDCVVRREQNDLFLNGVSYIWPNNRLIPRSRQVFEVDSFPYTVHFEVHEGIHSMRMTGPEQLFCVVNNVFIRDDSHS